jgi:hypothetical protein
MTEQECKEIISDPKKSDEKAIRALIMFTGGPNDNPRGAAETIELTKALLPFFKEHRPNIDPELVKRVDRECAEERRKYILANWSNAQIVRICITPHK